MRKIFYLAFLTLIIFYTRCSKDEPQNAPISQVQIWNCYQSKNWDEVKVFDALVGRWQWIYSENYTEGNGNSTESEKMIVEFFSDSTMLVFVNDRPGDTTKWLVIPKDGSLYGLKCDSSVAQLQGRILNCGDILEFNNSYIDGIDNYFERLEPEEIKQDTTALDTTAIDTTTN